MIQFKLTLMSATLGLLIAVLSSSANSQRGSSSSSGSGSSSQHHAAHGYGVADSRYFRHGSSQNEANGGTCTEFLQINSLDKCCAHRDDDCYMIHYDTRCYCDVFCDRSRFPDNSDCCPDAVPTCIGEPVVEQPPAEVSNDCYKDGNYYRNGETLHDNCNECRCENGKLECSANACLVNTDLLNQVNENRGAWTAANYSMFWGKTLDFGYRHRLGTKIPNKQQRALQVDDKPIQDAYDFRDEPFMANNGRRDMIRDQGNCAASWAFSTIDVATDRSAKVYEGKKGNESASVQMLISCAILPGNANGCSPAPVDVAWKFIENSNKDSDGKIVGGLVNEKCYPFESAESGVAAECKTNTNANRIVCPSDNRVYNKPLLNSGPGYPLKVESSNDIMDEIIKNGPVQVIFKVFDDFFMYKSGVYTKSPNARVHNAQEPYHSVKVLGWGTDNGVDYWLAANSWGEQWGENGYFRINREDDETEFGRYVYGGWGNRPVNTKNKNTNFGKRNRNFQRRE